MLRKQITYSNSKYDKSELSDTPENVVSNLGK